MGLYPPRCAQKRNASIPPSLENTSDSAAGGGDHRPRFCFWSPIAFAVLGYVWGMIENGYDRKKDGAGALKGEY